MSKYISVDAIKYLIDIKTISIDDVIEVVQCGNCEYYKYTICQNPNGLPRYLDENEFCSNGKERKKC